MIGDLGKIQRHQRSLFVMVHHTDRTAGVDDKYFFDSLTHFEPLIDPMV